MSLATFAALAVFGLSSPTNPTQSAQAMPLVAQTMTPFVSTQGTVTRRSDKYMTTPQGCSYRLTKAPGYPERWILIVNPQRLGLPAPKGRCRAMK